MYMRKLLQTLATALLLTLAFSAQAEQRDAPPPGCSSWGDVPTKLMEECARVSGNPYIICAGGIPQCCKKGGDKVTRCSTRPSDLGKPGPDQGGVNTKPPAAARPKTPSTPIKPIKTAPAPAPASIK